MKRAAFLMSLLLCAIVLVDLSFVVMARTFDHPHLVILPVMMLALPSSQAGMLATYLVFGSGRRLVRLVIVVLAVFIWSWLLSLSLGPFAPESSEWAFYLLALVIAIAGPLSVASLRGVRLRRSVESADSPAARRASLPWQFSLRRIMIWTAVVAVLLAARHLVSVPDENIADLTTLVISSAVVTLLSVWAMLGTRRLRWTVPAAWCSGIPLSTVLNNGLENLWLQAALSAMEFILAALMLAVVRICGYRLVQFRRGRQEDAKDVCAEKEMDAVVESVGGTT